MKVFLKILLIIMLLPLIAGCSKNHFTVVFELPSDVNATYRLVYYASNSRGGLVYELAAAVSNGKAEVECPGKNPTLLYVIPGFGNDAVAVYVEKGDRIVIKGKSAYPADWEISGNDVTERIGEWRSSAAKALSAPGCKERNMAVAAYVESHRDDPVSTILLATEFSRRDDEAGYMRLREMLEGDAVSDRIFEVTARNDAMHMRPHMPARVRRLRMHTLSEGETLLNVDSAKATMLYFWVTGIASRQADIDTLRNLSAQWPDSAVRNIADICIEPDSVTWMVPLRSDSLKKTVRAWMPLGFADRRAMKMGLERVPFVIVTGRDGRQVYRGDDISEASRVFRSLMTDK